MFDAEVYGLDQLHEACTDIVRVPQPIATGYLSEHDHDQGAWFLSEFIPMKDSSKTKSPNRYREFARFLAKMHQISADSHSQSPCRGQFGLDVNNFYIHTEQDNTWQKNWCTFFLEQRLKPVVKRMKYDPVLIDDHRKNMELILLCDRLIPYVPWFLESSQDKIRPCLLHGDLSGQNWSWDHEGRIVIFDGSPFYGSYEMDIHTMPETFLQAYFAIIGGPLEGYEMRFELYNLVRYLRCITDTELDMWRPMAFECLSKLLKYCGAWISTLVQFPCGLKTPTNKIKHLSSSTDSTIKKPKNVILVYGGSFCPIHFNHLAVMDLVAETLEKPPYNFNILGGYFCPSSETWIKKKLSENYLPNAYRESLLLVATEGTRWMVDRSYLSAKEFSNKIQAIITDLFGEDFELTLIHVCGLDAIQANEKRVPTRYPLVVIDRAGYNGEHVWKEYLQKTTVDNRERLIWISPWPGKIRSSTMIRHLLANSVLNNQNDNDIRQSLQDLLPTACLDYILTYNLHKWFKLSDIV